MRVTVLLVILECVATIAFAAPLPGSGLSRRGVAPSYTLARRSGGEAGKPDHKAELEHLHQKHLAEETGLQQKQRKDPPEEHSRHEAEWTALRNKHKTELLNMQNKHYDEREEHKQ